MLALENMFMFHKDMGILLGYDHSCNKLTGCSGTYYSLDGQTELNSLAEEFNDKIGKSFTPVRGNPVLILANGMLKTVSLETAYINAIPCSSLQEKVTVLKCGENL